MSTRVEATEGCRRQRAASEIILLHRIHGINAVAIHGPSQNYPKAGDAVDREWQKDRFPEWQIATCFSTWLRMQTSASPKGELEDV